MANPVSCVITNLNDFLILIILLMIPLLMLIPERLSKNLVYISITLFVGGLIIVWLTATIVSTAYVSEACPTNFDKALLMGYYVVFSVFAIYKLFKMFMEYLK